MALLLIFSLIAAACGSDDESTDADGDTSESAAESDESPDGDDSSDDDSSDDDSSDDETTEDADESDELNLYFIGVTSSQSFSIEQATGAEEAGRVYGAKVTALAPADPTDVATQVQLFNEALLDDPDGIVLFTLAPDQFTRGLADAAAAGVAVLAADVPLGGVPAVSNDNPGAGARLAEAALSLVPADATGTVVIGSPAPGVPVLDLRAMGIADAVAELRPDLEVAGPFETGLDPVANQAAWTDLVATNGDGVASLGVGDQDAASLAQIRRTDGGEWVNGGFDLNDTALSAIGVGDLDFLADPQHFLKGFVGIRLLVEHLNDGTALPDGIFLTRDNLVTPENVDDIIARQESATNRTDWYQPIVDELFANPTIINPGG